MWQNGYFFPQYGKLLAFCVLLHVNFSSFFLFLLSIVNVFLRNVLIKIINHNKLKKKNKRNRFPNDHLETKSILFQACRELILMNRLELATELKLRKLFAAIIFTWTSGVLLKVKDLRQLQIWEKKWKTTIKMLLVFIRKTFWLATYLQRFQVCASISYRKQNKSCHNRNAPSKNWVTCSSQVQVFSRRSEMFKTLENQLRRNIFSTVCFKLKKNCM